MKMFEEIGRFQPDALIVGNRYPILKAGIGLKAGQGLLKRGSLIMKCADGAGYIAGNADEDGKIFGILTDDSDTGSDASADNIPATVYQTGEFNRAAVIVFGENAAVENYEEDMKCAGMFLRSVQGYE